jgi:hypothetical protein
VNRLLWVSARLCEILLETWGRVKKIRIDTIDYKDEWANASHIVTLDLYTIIIYKIICIYTGDSHVGSMKM